MKTKNQTHRQDNREDDLDDVAAGWVGCQPRFTADAKQVGGKACCAKSAPCRSVGRDSYAFQGLARGVLCTH
jgi:hypothetical protein